METLENEGKARLIEELDKALRADIIRRVSVRVGREAAEDVAQETLISTWGSLQRYDPDRASLPAWVNGISHHKAIDAVRKWLKHIKHVNDFEVADWEVADTSLGIEAELESAEREAELKELLSDLLPAEQEAINLCFFEGLSRSEAAEQLGIPLGTLKSRIFVALKKLRQKIDSAEIGSLVILERD